jgi:hypothetical protein
VSSHYRKYLEASNMQVKMYLVQEGQWVGVGEHMDHSEEEHLCQKLKHGNWV